MGMTLPSTGRTDQSHHFAGIDTKGYIYQDRRFGPGGIDEGEMLYLQTALRRQLARRLWFY